MTMFNSRGLVFLLCQFVRVIRFNLENIAVINIELWQQALQNKNVPFQGQEPTSGGNVDVGVGVSILCNFF